MRSVSTVGELDQESDQPPAQLELEEKEEDDEWDDNLSSAEEVPSLPQAKSWADEPSSLDPLLAEEPLEDQEPAGHPAFKRQDRLGKEPFAGHDAMFVFQFQGLGSECEARTP